jgi:hypothetical protein
MITDLERNDLGAICAYGSVHATDLLKLERYEQVFHLVSTIQGELRPGIGHVEALQRCFPGGSITGAPKLRAMEIIHELEPIPRGVYTGAIGWIGFNGESHFNIAIRTWSQKPVRRTSTSVPASSPDSDPSRNGKKRSTKPPAADWSRAPPVKTCQSAATFHLRCNLPSQSIFGYSGRETATILWAGRGCEEFSVDKAVRATTLRANEDTNVGSPRWIIIRGWLGKRSGSVRYGFDNCYKEGAKAPNVAAKKLARNELKRKGT